MIKRAAIMNRFDGIRACLEIDMVDDDEFVSFIDLTAIFGVSLQTVTLWSKKYNFEVIKLGGTRYISGKFLKKLIVEKQQYLKQWNINKDDIQIQHRGRGYS